MSRGMPGNVSRAKAPPTRAYHQADRPDAFRATLARIRQTDLQPDDIEPRDRRELTPPALRR